MQQVIDIPALIDRNRLSRFQIGMLVLCGLCVIMDGFDVQAMGYVAPAIIKDWKISKQLLGPVFAAGMLGMLVGSLIFSILADRLGRRPVLIVATLFFAVCMLLTPMATDLTMLQVIRFITGLGLGAVMPNAMALAGEYSPSRSKVTLMMLVSCGFTVGAVLGGVLSSLLIPQFGWQSVFVVGGTIPLVLGLLMWAKLPESMQFLVLRGRDSEKVGVWLQQIEPSFRLQAGTRLQVLEAASNKTAVMELFAEGRTKVTLLLWVINFMNLINLYFLANWLPTIANSAGLSGTNAVLVGTSLQVGGTLGTILMGRWIDRKGFRRILIPAFVVATLAIAAIGLSGASVPLLFAATIVAGFCVVGGQPAVNALAASFYPTSVRSTGIGWSLGIGRIGSVVGPMLGGVLLGLKWENTTIFFVFAIPALISAIMLVLMGQSAPNSSVPQIARGQQGSSMADKRSATVE